MTRAVSTSEIGDYNKCQTSWKFKYHEDYRLQPLTDGPAVTKGVTGHKGLEHFYKRIMEGASYWDAANFVTDQLRDAGFKFMTSDPEKAAMYADLGVRLGEYFKHYESDFEDWEILGVEENVRASETLATGEVWDFVGQVDLIIRYRRGKNIGQVAIVDHKFLYNFWGKKSFDTSPQAAGYLRAARLMHPDWDIDHMLFNEIRFRMDAVEKFRRTEVKPTRVRSNAVARNHAKIAKKINALSQLSRRDVDIMADRAFVQKTCEYCNFATLCTMQMDGLDTSTTEKVNFKPNTYGYQNSSED